MLRLIVNSYVLLYWILIRRKTCYAYDRHRKFSSPFWSFWKFYVFFPPAISKIREVFTKETYKALKGTWGFSVLSAPYTYIYIIIICTVYVLNSYKKLHIFSNKPNVISFFRNALELQGLKRHWWEEFMVNLIWLWICHGKSLFHWYQSWYVYFLFSPKIFNKYMQQ